MTDKESKDPNKRAYPGIYEKVIPILMGLIGLAIIILLLVILAVVTGVFPGS